MSRLYFFLIVTLFLFFFLPRADSGLFSHGGGEETKQAAVPQGRTEDIKIVDSVDKLIIRRKKEAEKLIADGNKLIKKGKKKNRQDLITKGQIKKEIGEKQLKMIKEMTDNKRKEEEGYEW